MAATGFPEDTRCRHAQVQLDQSVAVDYFFSVIWPYSASEMAFQTNLSTFSL